MKAKKGGLSAGCGSQALAKHTDVVSNKLLATAGQAAIKETGALMQAQMFPQGECHHLVCMWRGNVSKAPSGM